MEKKDYSIKKDADEFLELIKNKKSSPDNIPQRVKPINISSKVEGDLKISVNIINIYKNN